MVLIEARRLNALGKFQYRIDVPDVPLFVTEDAQTAFEKLTDLGFFNVQRLLEHARNWGSLEIKRSDS